MPSSVWPVRVGVGRDEGSPGLLPAEEFRGRQRQGVERGFIDRDSHLLELVLQLARRPLAIVGQEQELVPPRLEPLHEFERAGDQPAAMVDHSVHVIDIAHRHRRWLLVLEESRVPAAKLFASFGS